MRSEWLKSLRRPSPASLWPLVLTITVGVASYAACFYPGAMSYDSAAMWAQVRGAPTDNVHGVGLLWLWRATEFFWSGPAPIFLIQLVLFWTGLAMIAQSLPWRMSSRIAFVLIVAASPVLFVVLAHIWADPMLIAALTIAVAATLRYRDSAHGCWTAIFALTIFFALTLRHNALPAVIPLIVYFAYLWNRQRAVDRARPLFRTLVITAATTLLAMLGATVLDRQVVHRLNVFPATAVWDLAAVSLIVDAIVIPPTVRAPDLTLDDLRGAYVPYANVPIFSQTHYRAGPPFLAPDDLRNAEIRDAWLEAINQYPAAYFAHRWNVTRALFGSKPHDWPHELIYVDEEVQLGDNPPVAANRNTLHLACMRVIETLRDGVALAAWPYLLLAWVALTLAWRRRWHANAQAALAVLVSGLFYAAPLPLIAPSAELRYLGWTCACALIGSALVIATFAAGPPIPATGSGATER